MYPLFCSILAAIFSFGEVETDRLRLRTWRNGDVEAIHALMQDPEVTRELSHCHLDQHATLQRLAERSNKSIQENGYGYFLCELKETGEAIGVVALNYTTRMNGPHFPCYTVSWVLGRRYWKQGYATEAARALIGYGLEQCHMPEIFAFTDIDNVASIQVMERIGMQFLDQLDGQLFYIFTR